MISSTPVNLSSGVYSRLISMLHYDPVEALNAFKLLWNQTVSFPILVFSRRREGLNSKADKAPLHNKSAGPHFVDLGQKLWELRTHTLRISFNSSCPFPFFSLSLGFSFDTRPECINRPIWMRSSWPNCTLRYETCLNSEGFQLHVSVV